MSENLKLRAPVGAGKQVLALGAASIAGIAAGYDEAAGIRLLLVLALGMAVYYAVRKAADLIAPQRAATTADPAIGTEMFANLSGLLGLVLGGGLASLLHDRLKPGVAWIPLLLPCVIAGWFVAAELVQIAALRAKGKTVKQRELWLALQLLKAIGVLFAGGYIWLMFFS